MKLQQFLGGIEGLGPVAVEKRVFVQPWEARLFGVHATMMGTSIWAWPDLRVKAEGMNPLDYFKYRYYIKWQGAMAEFLIERGYIEADELDALTQRFLDNPDTPLPDTGNSMITDRVIDYLWTGDNPYRNIATRPRFKVGDNVCVKDVPLGIHTRLPGYLRNKIGVVEVVYDGAYLYWDKGPTDGLGTPQPVYNVRFNTTDIWPEIPDHGDVLYNDFFEVYLDSAQSQ
ncbi:nitrile hydratase subunit beta [Pseudomonas silvicola]|nr:nitrile hydratase subunit beta [Pseudomonas silvicola]